MASVNRVTILGNLGRDPETRTFPSGGQVCNIRVATTETWTDKQTKEKREATEWHSIVFSDRLAEVAAQYLKKGSQVYVEGQLRTRKWTDKDGAERYSTEIRADRMQLLGGIPKSVDNEAGQAQRKTSAPARGDSGFEADDSTIPF